MSKNFVKPLKPIERVWPELERYQKEREGKLRLQCEVCGLGFWAEKERRVCGLECSKRTLREAERTLAETNAILDRLEDMA